MPGGSRRKLISNDKRSIIGFIDDNPAINDEPDAPGRRAFVQWQFCLRSKSIDGGINARGLSGGSWKIESLWPCAAPCSSERVDTAVTDFAVQCARKFEFEPAMKSTSPVDLLPTFDEFFEALWGFDPFPWQRMLTERVSTGIIASNRQLPSRPSFNPSFRTRSKAMSTPRRSSRVIVSGNARPTPSRRPSA